MRTWKQAEEAGKNVGFQLLQSRDVALASLGAVGMWCVARSNAACRCRLPCPPYHCPRQDLP